MSKKKGKGSTRRRGRSLSSTQRYYFFTARGSRGGGVNAVGMGTGYVNSGEESRP